MHKPLRELFRLAALTVACVAVASAAPISFTISGSGGAVADGGSASVFTVSTARYGVVTDVNLWFRDISHTFIGDLVVTLAHEDEEPIYILNRAGRGSSGFGYGSNLITGGVYAFSDGGASIVNSNSGVLAHGTYAPVDSLSAFNGSWASGPWTLSITDAARADVANSTWTWGLDITAETPEPSYALGVAGVVALLAFLRRRA
jgi:subtilisin-like proprotein convertase family protein